MQLLLLLGEQVKSALNFVFGGSGMLEQGIKNTAMVLVIVARRCPQSYV